MTYNKSSSKNYRKDYSNTIQQKARNKKLTPLEDDGDALADPDAIPEFEKFRQEILASDDFSFKEAAEIIRNKENSYYQEHLDQYSNSFPLEVFPKKIKAYIENCAESLSASKEYIAAGVLCAAAGAIGNKFQLSLKEGLPNSACLYMVIVGPTGTNKSLPLETALQPLFAIEEELAEVFNNKRENLKQGETEKRCIVNDCTMEAIVEILETNAITVYHDEFAGFLKSFNRYRAGDDMEKWLSIWSNAHLRSDRKNNKGKLIKRPFANCVGTIQQDVLINFLAQNDSNNGFNERLLFVTTDQHASPKWNNNEINPDLKEHYTKVIKAIFNNEPSIDTLNKEPHNLKYSASALEHLMDWQHDNARKMDELGNNQLVGVCKKLEIYAIRFSLILAILEYAERAPKLLKQCKISVTDKHVKAAIAVTEYFRASAKRILSFKPDTKNTQNLNPRQASFFESLPEQFSCKTALEIGKEQGLSVRTVRNYLDRQYFKKIRHGIYKKKFKMQ